MALRRKATKGLSADQLRDALGQLTAQAKPRRQWVTAARSAAWRGRWWLVPAVGFVAAWVVGAVIATSGIGWLPVLLVGPLFVGGLVLLARPLPERDQPWVWVPAVFVVAYWVATAIGG